MSTYQLTKKQACRFLLRKQGLLGNYKFQGKQGILDFIHQAGCIQYDPIDVWGKNSELVLQSRIKGVTKKMLYELLYEERSLIDYFDKNLAIFPVEDWCYFERKRNLSKTFQEELEQAIRRFAKFNECQKEIVMG